MSTASAQRWGRRRAGTLLAASITATAAVALGLGGATAGASAPAPWSYSGSTGPAFWGSLDPAYAACSDGTRQSPIDIARATRRPLRDPHLAYLAGTATVFDNGHTVEAEANPGSTLTLDGVSYSLRQIHFHAHSEHEVDGRYFPVEVHFVHESAAGAVVVLAVLVEEGRKDNPAWAPYVDALAVPRGEEEHVRIDWAALLPKDRRSYRYDGSLTTPPCTQGVRWVVLARPVRLGDDQIAAFRKAYDGNYRPIQPRNGRTVVLDVGRR